MTPVMQQEDNDCLRACVASLLGLPLEEVLHFCDGEHETNGQWLPRLIDWCTDRGVGVLYANLDDCGVIIAGARCIFGGLSPAGARHSVIGRGEWEESHRKDEGVSVGKWSIHLEHDPYPHQCGLATIDTVLILLPWAGE